MKLPPFDYAMVESLSEAFALLDEHGYDAKVLAGGQSLVPLMAFRLVRPAVVVDVNRVPGLDYVEEGNGGFSIGALTRHRTVETHPRLRSRLPAVRDALQLVGHVPIRNRGTVGGSLAHADPAAEWPALAVLLDCQVVIASAHGTRRVAAEEFFTGYMSTVLEPSEVVTALDVRMPPEGAGSAFVEFARRHGDYAQAGAGAVVAVEDGQVTYARTALLGVGVAPVRAPRVEEALVGERPDAGVLRRVSALAAEAMRPVDDVHAPAGYRRHLGVVMLRRALEQATARAEGTA